MKSICSVIACALLMVFGYTHVALGDGQVIIKTETGKASREEQKTDSKVFCSKKDEQDAAARCREWLAAQLKTLGDRLLTSHCSDGEISTDEGCLYRAAGEVKYVLRAKTP